MLSNKVRNDSWWLLKCFDYLAGPLQMADTNRNNFLDFRRVIEERMAEYSREIEGLEGKLNEEKEKSHRVSLEITEKTPVSQVQVVPTIQHSNQFLEVLEPVAPVTRVTVTKETSPVKAKIVVPLPAEEPEEEEAEEEAEEEEAEEADNEEEEEEDEPEPEENYEQIRIKKTNYWLETISRKVYQITAEGDVGDLVANYKLVNGVATLAPL
jgi:antitoxin (DNA-binding transcriptional repressor) of toxin-antitoxin stability system